jgi:hypothetical protein
MPQEEIQNDVLKSINKIVQILSEFDVNIILVLSNFYTNPH